MTNTIAKRQNGNSPVSFGNVVDNIFQNSLRRFFDGNFWDMDTPLTAGTAPANIRETDLLYEMDIIAPGCRKEDFSINVDKNVLTVSFAHQDEQNQKDEKAGWVRNEYVQRSFSRSFTLDETVDTNKITATYKDGILHLVLPKNEKAQKPVKNIEIK